MGDTDVKLLGTLLIGLLAAVGTVAQAADTTEQEVRQQIMDNNAYANKNLKGPSDEYSKDGATEFWSSGGLMQEISANGRPEEFEIVNIAVKHLKVTTLVPGKVAMAHYYSEGTQKVKGGALVPHYFTRVSQIFVKEGGKWKIRASHWSAVLGGSGTTQTAVEE